MAAKLIVAPDQEPVSVDAAKSQLGISGSSQDDLVALLIQASRERIEKMLGRALITQTWELSLDEFPCQGAIELPLVPVQSITSIKYDDEDGEEQTVSSGDYYLDDRSEPSWVLPIDETSWGISTLDAVNAVRVRFLAGYGDDPDDVPAPIRLAILRDVTLSGSSVGIQTPGSLRSERVDGLGSFDYQVSSVTIGSGGIDATVQSLLNPYRTALVL